MDEWEQGAAYMLRSIMELIGNGGYSSKNVLHWVCKEYDRRGLGRAWKTDLGQCGGGFCACGCGKTPEE